MHKPPRLCSTRPINREDPSGYFWGPLLAGIGSVIVIPAGITAVITVEVVAIAVLIVVAIVDVAVQEYRNHHVTYTNSSTPAVNKTKSKSSGKAKNKLKPDTRAKGPHSTFKRNPDTGGITNYKTWKPNPLNPRGFDAEVGYDGIGKPHKNPFTGESLMPHVHDKTVPGEVRPPISWEVPGMPR